MRLEKKRTRERRPEARLPSKSNKVSDGRVGTVRWAFKDDMRELLGYALVFPSQELRRGRYRNVEHDHPVARNIHQFSGRTDSSVMRHKTLHGNLVTPNIYNTSTCQELRRKRSRHYR